MQSALLLQDPKVAEQLGTLLAAQFPQAVSAVLSPALGGVVIGHEVARAKGARAVFAEKDEAGKPILRRGFSLAKNDTVLVVEDVVTTGLSTREVAALVEKAGAQWIGTGSIVNRSGKDLTDLKLKALLTLEVKTWQAEACPLCKQGTPAVKPGSRKQ